MPTRHPKSKEDTWTTDELNRALQSDDRRRHHDRDEDRKRERINGEDRHRRKREEDTEKRRHHRDDDRRSKRDEEAADHRTGGLTEEERERQRQERRERREKEKTDGRHRDKKEIQFINRGDDRAQPIDVDEDDNSSDHRSKHREDRERRHGGDDDRERRRKHREEREENDEAERERRRKERREQREKKVSSKQDDERRRRHEEKKERREEDRDRRRDRDDRSERRERNGERDRDREEKYRDREKRHREDREDRDRSHRDRDREKEKEERRREKEERERDKDDSKKKKESRREEEKSTKKQEEEEEGNDYEYEEDFEDYEEDFEEDDEDEQIQGSIHRTNRTGTALDYSDSEVNDVLRALDAENERLLSSQAKSPQPSYDYGRRSGHDQSDEEEPDGYQPRPERPRTAINFVSAKQRAISRKTASKTAQRGKDLLQMLELDFASFDILDLPPVKEYDLYIRAFGRSDTRQAYVQTNDDNIDRDIQTDEIDYRSKWTQYPPEDFKGSGRGDGEKDLQEEEYQIKHSELEKEQDSIKLNRFLEKAGQVIAILLEESRDEMMQEKGQSQTHINVSDGYTELEMLPFLQVLRPSQQLWSCRDVAPEFVGLLPNLKLYDPFKLCLKAVPGGRHVEFAHFSPTQPNLLLTVYSRAPEVTAENPISKRGIVCVWNTNDPMYPQKILCCSSQPKCCCFSPVKPSLVFAGMVDGSVVLWDLRESTSIHRTTEVEELQYSLRYPTYDTAGILDNENHHSPVVTIAPIYSYIESSISSTQAVADSSPGMSFQLVSTEEAAVLHFWVVAEINEPDLAGAQNDLGLSPGGRVKLLKSSSLTLDNPSRDAHLKSGLRALDMNILPSDPNQFYVGTDLGFITHGVRFGTRAYPRAHSPVIESIVDVTSIDFSPFNQPCFLAGCSDGSFSLYHTKSENPLVTWSTVTKGRPIQCVRWSRSRPCVFFVLDNSSNLYVFNIVEGDSVPKQIEQISKHRVVSFCLTNDHKALGLGTPGKEPQMLFGLESGKTEIHTVTQTLRVPEELELEYLSNYLTRF